MGNKNIDTLNDVTRTLIDSQHGYEKAYNMADDNFSMRAEFQRRATERQHLVDQFQQQVRSFGGAPQISGGTAGALQRQFTQFSTMWQNDTKAALGAIDDGEEYLADKIETKLKESALTSETRKLLKEAYTQAKAGEAFAERWEDRV